MKANMLAIAFLLVAGVADGQSVLGWGEITELTGLPSQSSVISAYSNGHGQHVLVGLGGGGVDYFLLDNDGSVLNDSPAPFPISAGSTSASITGYDGVVYVAIELGDGTIRVFWSTTGGATWQSSASYSPPGTVANLDASADLFGVHIAWDTEGTSNSEIYYVRYEPFANRFVYPQHITNMGLVTGRFPKVVTTANNLVVSFATTHLEGNDRGGSRDASLSFGQPSWEADARLTPILPVDFANQSIAALGNTLHILLFQNTESGHAKIYSSSRTLEPSADWNTPTELETDNRRRHEL
ncbi:MAG: hypothetical protein HY961_04120 [Ignavibacteriae bacterium]|nr:hypothetical protein [Ignavibacteriota bacterium]